MFRAVAATLRRQRIKDTTLGATLQETPVVQQQKVVTPLVGLASVGTAAAASNANSPTL